MLIHKKNSGDHRLVKLNYVLVAKFKNKQWTTAIVKQFCDVKDTTDKSYCLVTSVTPQTQQTKAIV